MSVVVIALVIGGGLVACGDDDDDGGTTTTTAAGGDEGAVSAETCDAYIDVTHEFNAEETDADAVNAHLDTLESDPPAEVADELAVMIEAAREVAESGDFSAFESDEFGEAQGVVDPFFFENCEADEKAEVSAVEFEFQGAPEELPAGRVAFLFENNGAELHEMVLLRKNDDTEETFDEILELPEEEAMGLVEADFVAFAFPGATTANWVDLEAGEYTMVCFIPVGSTPDAGEEGGDGPPHFVEGMRHDFEVA